MINEFELLANKVIEATKEVSLSEEEQTSIQQLFQLGGEQGYITLNDIASQFPESEASLPVIERVYDMLLNAGIEILDDEEVSSQKPAVPVKENEVEKEDENKLAEVSAIDAIDSVSYT